MTKGLSPWTARLVWERAGGLCEHCKAPGVQIHHKEPRGMGGRHGRAKQLSDDPENLELLCLKCHGNVSLAKG